MTVLRRLRCSRFRRRSVLAVSDLLGILGIAGHRIALNRNESSEIVGKLAIEDKRLFHIVRLKLHSRLAFFKSIDVTTKDVEIDAFPCPIEACIAFPPVPALI